MSQLNVNLADLAGVADQYQALQQQAAALSPRALEEVQRIAETHGPMGYPVAVGVVARLARDYGRVDAKAADFGAHSQRFTEHAATYADEDARAAQRYEALDLREGLLPPVQPHAPSPRLDVRTCWIGTADGDTSACHKDTTEYLYLDKGTWKLRQADNGFVTELADNHGTSQHWLDHAPAPGTDPFAEAAPHDVMVWWKRPDESLVSAYRNPDGTIFETSGTAPGGEVSLGDPMI